MDLQATLIGMLVGTVIGCLVSWFVLRARFTAEKQAAVAAVQAELLVETATAKERADQADMLARSRYDELTQARKGWEAKRDELDSTRNEASRLQERVLRIPALEQEVTGLRSELGQANSEASSLKVEVESLRQQLRAEHDAAAEKLDVLTKAQDSLTDQFKVLAAEIFDSSSKRLQEHNQTSLSMLLDPLKQRLSDFQKKVEDVYVDESKERSALKQQVENLVRLNQVLSDDAKNLTSALRGSAKSQGNWGELILERVLEASGLRKGEEYLVQDSKTNEDGQRQQPDVVINLPEERRLVVDSKVSLVAYERFASAETDTVRAEALRDHLGSVRNHMRGLSDKGYQKLYGQSLDFVLMFIPIEPAFMTAVTNDPQLFMDAWERNVLLVSPSTLLFVVRTVAHLWRQEAQSRNAQDIARRGGELYDKLTGFVSDLESVGGKLDAAQQAFEDAKKKLTSGKGNVIRQAELLRNLGVKPSKQLPKGLVDLSIEPDEAQPLLGAPAPPSS